VRFALAVVAFAASLVAVVPAQTYRMWQGSIGATELGHYIALIALLALLPGWRKSREGRIAALIAGAAVAISLSPLVRAWPVAAALREAVSDMKPGSGPGALPQPSPLRLTRLFLKPASPDVGVQTLTYTTRAGKPVSLDLYRRESTARQPLVMIIHGGSWSGGTRADLPELNVYLAARGYVVASPDYRLAPQFPFPAQTEDINAAIDYLKTNAATLGIDPRKIVLAGRSAGGQLALLSAYSKNDRSIRGAISFYGPTDQKWGWDNPTNQRVYDSFATLRGFLGGSPEEKADAYRLSSPLSRAGGHVVPTLLIHGAMDPLVSIEQSARLDSALSRSGVPHLFIRMPWATHGCDYVFNGPCGQISTYAIERFVASVTR
jgi:acetyl esterase/lipase